MFTVTPICFSSDWMIAAIVAWSELPESISSVVGEALRHAGVGHLLLGVGDVVLQAGRRLLVVRHLRRHERVRLLAVAEQHGLDHRLPVDGLGDGPAHVHVVERRLLLVKCHVVGARRVEQAHGDAGGGLERGNARPGGELVDLRLAALELELPRVVARRVGPGHAVQVRQARLPVVRVLYQLERLALVPVVPLERAGADRRLVEGGLGLAAVVVRHDVVREQRQVGEQRGPRELEADYHGLRGRRRSLT